MRTLRPAPSARFCTLAVQCNYLVRCPVHVMKRICPLQTVSDAFHGRRQRAYTYYLAADDLELPCKATMQALINMVLSECAAPLPQSEIRLLVTLLDYMGCNDATVWTLVAQSMHFDPLFLDTLATVAVHARYEPIANMAACSDHPISLCAFQRGTDLYHALLCIAVEKSPTAVPDSALASVPVDLDVAFPGWNMRAVMLALPTLAGAIAGGAVCGHLAGFRGTDMDLFVWNATTDTLYAIWAAIETVHPDVSYVTTKHTVTFTIPASTTPLQVIPLQDQMSGAALVQSFDLDPCCCFIPWGGGRIFLHPRAEWALKTRTMDLRNATKIVHSDRVAKYEARGFARGRHPSGIFLAVDRYKVGDQSHLPRRANGKLGSVHPITNRYAIDTEYFGTGSEYVTTTSWTSIAQRSNDIRLGTKPWCKDLHGTPVLFQCMREICNCKTGYQILYGVKSA